MTFLAALVTDIISALAAKIISWFKSEEAQEAKITSDNAEASVKTATFEAAKASATTKQESDNADTAFLNP